MARPLTADCGTEETSTDSVTAEIVSAFVTSTLGAAALAAGAGVGAGAPAAAAPLEAVWPAEGRGTLSSAIKLGSAGGGGGGDAGTFKRGTIPATPSPAVAGTCVSSFFCTRAPAMLVAGGILCCCSCFCWLKEGP